jgi:hypothetical protein
MQEKTSKPVIYISYAWNPESDDIVGAIEKEFTKRGVRIIRDKNDLKYKERIKDFMEVIGRGKYVILIISNKYLKSENCMFELLQIFKNQDFYERIFPVVMEDVSISKATDRIELVKYWENEANNLDSKIRELKKLSNIQGVTEDLNLYTAIRNNIAKLTNILKDINYLNTENHISSNFKQLYEVIQAKIEKDSRIENSDNEKDGINRLKRSKLGKKILIGFTGLLAIILIIQFIGQTSFFRNEQSKEQKGENEIATGNLPIVLEQNDKIEMKNELVKEDRPIVSNIKYDVTLVVPSSLSKADVYVDNRQAEVINRGLNTITVRLRKKTGSHHFEIKKGSQNCIADKIVEKDAMRFAMLCN